MTDPFYVAIAGLGTVGAGVVKILQDNKDLIAARAGRPIEIAGISARDKTRDRGVDLSQYTWVDDAQDLANLEDADCVVELIGGANGPALSLVEQALSQGKHVVTANKALLAHHGAELAERAENNAVSLNYEAAVAGGIPAIKALREGLTANRINGIYGILNGTCNYILTQMRETGRSFDAVLKEAQDKGYAEADPTFDIDGIDAGHKLCILAAIAFGVKPDFKAVTMQGIRDLTSVDIALAEELGYKIKLLGVARAYGEDITMAVEPVLVPKHSPIGAVEDVYNAVYIEGDFVETPMLTGHGAGAGPTASAVVADIIDIARGLRLPTFGIPASKLGSAKIKDSAKIEARFYLRLTVLDQPGVLADVSAILRDHDISIEGLVQRGRDPLQPVPVVITTHDAGNQAMLDAVEHITALRASVELPCLMRIEDEL